MDNGGFTLEIDGFRGPLGLLLDLIQERKLHVNDVSLAQVADDYIRYIEDRDRVPLSETAQFVLIASTLLLIKSRSLLPTLALTEEEEADINELQRRLAQYAHVRRAARLLRGVWCKRSFLPRHTPRQRVVFAPSNDITAPALAATLHTLVEALPTFSKTPTARIAQEVRLDDVIARITDRVRTALNESFRTLTRDTDRVEAIVSFLALLELVKRGVLDVRQHATFADITMYHTDVSVPRYGH